MMLEPLGVALTLVMLGVILWMLLTGRLREKYAVLWLAIGLVVLILGLFPQTLQWLTTLLGVELPSNLLFALAILLLLGVTLHLSWELSRAEGESRRLAEESAIARAEIESLARRVEKLEKRIDSNTDRPIPDSQIADIEEDAD